MMRYYRHISFLFCALCFTPTLVSWVLTMHSCWIKYEMIERLENEQLHRIVLMPEDVHWHEKGSELNIDGQLFDVKDYKEESGKFVCWGIFDREETALVNWVENNTEKNEDDIFLSKVLVALLKLHLIETEPSVKSDRVETIACHYGVMHSDLPKAPFLMGSYPPPDRFSI
jgi:hypothetical protein